MTIDAFIPHGIPTIGSKVCTIGGRSKEEREACKLQCRLSIFVVSNKITQVYTAQSFSNQEELIGEGYAISNHPTRRA